MDGTASFVPFLFLVVPFVLMNIRARRKERSKANEELQALLRENNDLLKELLAK
jgi:preprotein translocase subunit YajC